jgi:ribosomal protein L34E
MPMVNCQQCGKAFSADAGRIRLGRAKYCSRSCSAAARRTPKEATCLWCRSTFTKGRGSQKYCSLDCANEALRAASYKKASSGKKKPNRPATLDCACFEDPWANGSIKPDKYGNTFRTPDFGLGF